MKKSRRSIESLKHPKAWFQMKVSEPMETMMRTQKGAHKLVKANSHSWISQREATL